MKTFLRFVLIMLFMAAFTACTTGSPGQGMAPALEPGRTEGLAAATAVSPTPTLPTETADPAVILLQTALTSAKDHCAATGRDQVCFVRGPVDVTFRPGADPQPFAQPGDTLDLALVEQLHVGGSSLNERGLAVVRLQAGMAAPEQYLTMLALGNVEISNIEPTTEVQAVALNVETAAGEPAAADDALPDWTTTEPLQSFSFATSPQAADTDVLPGGLLMWTPPGEEVASFKLNDTAVILGSTAFAQAQPGGAMTINMLAGTAVVQTGSDASTAVQGTQVSVPLADSGLAAAAPGQAVIPGDELFIPIKLTPDDDLFLPIELDPINAGDLFTPIEISPEDELFLPIKLDPDNADDWFIPIDPTKDELDKALHQAFIKIMVRKINQEFNRSASRCINEVNNRYVYNVLYWYRWAVLHAEIKAAIGAERLAEMEARAGQCLSFELDFDSTIQSITSSVNMTSQVRAEGVQIQFAPTGGLISEVHPLQYLRFEVENVGLENCTIRHEFENGTFQITDGTLKIRVNELRLTLYFTPTVPGENIYYTCQDASGMREIPVTNMLHWQALFGVVYPHHRHGEGFVIEDWKFTGNLEHFAEAIYEDSQVVGDYQTIETTFLVLVHTPVGSDN